MPTHYRVWVHDEQGRAPLSPAVGEQHTKQSISRAESGTLDRTLEHRQLLTQRQIFERHLSFAEMESAALLLDSDDDGRC
jgi:hypothetical protein